MSLAALAAAGGAQAQTTVSPTFSLAQTFTDNRLLSATNRRSESITRLSPGISLVTRSGRLQGSLTYAANINLYARDSQANAVSNSLSAFAHAELLERRLFVDTSATISQQTVSAFGVQSTDPNLNDRNRTEVRSLSIAPLLRGRLLGEVDYTARASYTTSHAISARGTDSSTLAGSLGVTGPPGLLSWSADLSRTIGEPSSGRRTHNGRGTASLIYAPSLELRGSLRAGNEWNDIQTGRSGSSATYGASLNWAPGPRTSAALQVDKRFFGNSHSISLSHRFARSVWVYSDTRNLSNNNVAGAPGRTLFDVWFELLASQFPNPAQREVEVLNRLREAGLDPNAFAGGNAGFLTSGPTVQRRQNLSMSWLGLRTTFNVSAFRGTTESVGVAALPGDDLASVGAVRQSGYTLTSSYRLTPVSSLTVAYSLQRTGNAGSRRGNDLATVNGAWSTSLGKHTAGSLSVRHSKFDSATNAYRESAVIGTLSVRF